MIDFRICCARQVLVLSSVPYLNVTQLKFLHSGGHSLCGAGHSASDPQPGETQLPHGLSPRLRKQDSSSQGSACDFLPLLHLW